MTTFHPSCNVYAAIAAGPSPEEREAEARARLQARAARVATIQAIYPPAVPLSASTRPKRASPAQATARLPRAESEARQKAATEEYAAAFLRIQSRYQHARLRGHLAAKYELSLSTIDRLTLAYREAQGVKVPRAVFFAGEQRLLHWLRANTSQRRALPTEAIVAALGMRSGHDLGNLIHRVRKSLQNAANPAARWIIAYDRDRQGYYFDHALVAQYPHLAAILEDDNAAP